MMRSQSSGGKLCSGSLKPPTPALFTSMSTRPNVLSTGGSVFELMEHGDVTGNDLCLAAGVNNGLSGLVERRLSTSEQYGSCAEGGQLAGNRRTNAAPSTGDDGDLSGEGLSGVHTGGSPSTKE